MNSLEQFRQYLNECQQRLRRKAAWRGAASIAVVAVAATLALVWWTNREAFSGNSLFRARFLLFLVLGLTASLALVVPLLRLSRRRAARAAEQTLPEFDHRVMTLADRENDANPFAELLARDVMRLAERATPSHVVRPRVLWGSALAASAGVVALLWLILGAPGYVGYGASLLWAGTPRTGNVAFYRIEVTPGDHKVRRGLDQMVAARLVGFESPRVRLWARYKSATRWEPVPMQQQPGAAAYEFLFAGLGETVEYYVEAGNVKSTAHTLTVIDLPGVKRIRVTYHYPGWAGLRDVTEDPGGDLRAVEGTEAEVVVETDRPLAHGLLALDNGTTVTLESAGGNKLKGKVAIRQDGVYHVAALEDGEAVRLSEDYFIEARKERPPVVRVVRPGRDAKVSPIEEVSVEVEGTDDFALEQLELHYSVNGGAEQTVPMLPRKGVTEARGTHLLALEDYKLVPGDMVSLYATARDGRSTTRSDMYFIEAQPFEKEYQQAQTGGGGGGGGGQQGGNISQRQKEIIAATWNVLRGGKPRAEVERDSAFLAGQQEKLAAQALSLARRMKSRELAGANQEFQSFAKDMETAAQAMKEATDQLRTVKMREALPPEQRALQHLLRAEAMFRQIQVAFGSQGGGGGGGSGRDLENLFDLELDTEKNQYETSASAQGEMDRDRAMDEALKKLEELARRQQELAQQQDPKRRQSFEQRWAQEMLRREAEELKRRMEQMSQGQGQGQGQSSSGQQSEQRSLSGMSGQGRQEERMQRAVRQLEQATEDMRRASSPSQSDSGDARRAADRLKEATSQLGSLRRQEAGSQMDQVGRKAQELAEHQKDFADRMKKTYGAGAGATQEQNEKFAQEKAGMKRDLERLEEDIKAAARSLESSQRGASSKLREALGEMQQKELKVRMQLGSDYLRRGYGPMLADREQVVTQGLERLRDQVQEAQKSLGAAPQGREQVERALGQIEKLRQEMSGQQQNGQQQQGGGQQPGGQQQGGQQQGGNPQAGQGRQPGGMQPGGPRQGGPLGGAQGGWYRDGFTAMNRGELQPPVRTAPLTPAEYDALVRAYTGTQRELSRLREEGADDPETKRMVEDLVKETQRLDPRRFSNDPVMLERIRAAMANNLQYVELQLRRKLDEDSGSGARSGSADKVPDGYADKVAEYFRRLSRAK